ncbi:32196_t:CDS:1, partial [Racocetra persica]
VKINSSSNISPSPDIVLEPDNIEEEGTLLYCRSKLIEPIESNRFYIYDAIDSTSHPDKKYMLSLLTIREDGTKFTINISVDS